MFRHGRKAHVERTGKLGDGELPGQEPREDGAAGRVGEGGEDAAETVR
jgi:hypothetical protein